MNLRERTAHVLATLTPREEKILKMRFGIEDGREHTLEEIGRSFAVTPLKLKSFLQPCMNASDSFVVYSS